MSYKQGKQFKRVKSIERDKQQKRVEFIERANNILNPAKDKSDFPMVR